MTISQQNKQVYIINQVINVFNDFKNTLILFSKQKIKMICILYYWKVICQVIFCVHLVSLQPSKTVLYKWPTFIVLKVSHYSRMLYHFFYHWNLLTQFTWTITKKRGCRCSLWVMGHLIWPFLHLNSKFNTAHILIEKKFLWVMHNDDNE